MTLVYPVVPQVDESASPADPELMAAVRTGDTRAYALLYERHEPAARGLARQLARSPHDVDDLIAEAFAKVFRMLRSGGGPDTAFRAYLLTTLRHARYERARRDRRLELSDDMARHDQGVPWTDPVEAELDSTLAARAFGRLPERWQAVLWYSEVEQESTAQVGQRLGLRPNAVAALAYRAREALREAYLQVQLSECGEDECRATVDRLGGWTRQRLSATDSAQVRTHLAGCASCRRLAAELGEINSGLRGLLAPLVPASWLVTAGAGAASGTGTAAATAVSAGGAAGGGVAAAVAAGGAVGGGAAAAATVSAGGAVGGGSVVGSVAAWVFGTHAGQAVAVVTAVVVGGTAVAAGGGAPHPGRHWAVAVADTRVVAGAGRTGGSAVAGPAAAAARVRPAQSTSAEAGRSTARSFEVKSGTATSSRGSGEGPGSKGRRPTKGSSEGKSSGSSASSENAADDGSPGSSSSNGSGKSPKDRSATGGSPVHAGAQAGSPAAESSAASGASAAASSTGGRSAAAPAKAGRSAAVPSTASSTGAASAAAPSTSAASKKSAKKSAKESAKDA